MLQESLALNFVMLFTVVVGIFMVIFSKINGCPTERSCRTANGTIGVCIQSKECPHIHRLNGGNLTPEELDFVRNSVCGVDLDKTKLFCCDKNGINPPVEATNHGDNVEISRADLLAEEDLPPYSFPSVPSTTPSPIRLTTSTPKPKPEPINCVTPNGERAICTSINDCTLLRDHILNSTRTELQKRFLKESACGGYDAEKFPIVCCGSDVNFNNLNGEENKYNFRENPLIPTGICGLQGSEIGKYMPPVPIPQISTRSLVNNNNRNPMNISLPNRIFGGVNSDLTEFPWTALLAYKTYNGSKAYACSGSLISAKYVLTAAHCVAGKNVESFASQLIEVRLGEWDYSKDRDCLRIDDQLVCNQKVLDVAIDTVILHPEYKPLSNGKYHDIALIRLVREVQFTQLIRPICLPTINDYVNPGERLTIAGWGLVNYNEETTIKQKVDVPVVSASQCSVMFEKTPKLTRIQRGQFCAGGEPGKDACVGDSGAPLMKKVVSSIPFRWTVEGIVSFGTGCGLAEKYGVYTKVTEYLGWIHKEIKP